MLRTDCKEILIASLDWGMGHTTRCVPIIDYMLRQGHHIIFAGNEWQCAYINNSFSSIETIHLKGYEVNYSKNPVLSVLSQSPRLLRTIRCEHEWLLQQTKSKRFDLIISDNRYGLWHPQIPSVIMTHQLQVITGMGNIADRLFQRLHYKMINRFSECWVVDVKASEGLAGKLSHPKHLPRHTKYIGLLSQLHDHKAETGSEDHLLILLSGPEPQRTILSNLLWQQAQGYKGKVVFVEGTNAAPTRATIPEHINYHRQLNKEQLYPLIRSSKIVICRSGYSSLMDLVALHKKAIIIPTPGQTEQEYLGTLMHEHGILYCTKQNNFNLQKTMDETASFGFKQMLPEEYFDQYRAIIDSTLARQQRDK